MKIYDVTIRATVTKIIRVEAEDEDEANMEARDQFSVDEVSEEDDYNEETLDIEEVQA